jgi:non-ribosomal peptide synthetase component F
VLRIDLSGSPTVTEALARARTAAVAAYAHQAMPFDQLVAELGPDRPALPVLVALNNYPGAGTGMADLELGPAPDETEHGYGPMLEFYSPEDVPFALAVSLSQIGDALLGGLEYDRSLFTDDAAGALADRLLRLLAAAAADPQAPIADLV